MEGRETFSIIVPTYRRPKPLAVCLESMARQDYPHGLFEVLVVDDGSPSPPHDIISAFSGKCPVSLLTPQHGGPAAARNAGAAKAEGKFLAFTDDDCTPSPSWLQALAGRLAQAPDCLIGGHTVNTLVDNPYSSASQMLIDYLYEYFNADHLAGSFFASNNICVAADAFRAIGGFDASFPKAAAEDRDFCDRWVKGGSRLIYAPEAIVYHAHSLALSSFWRQHFNYGRGAVHFRRSSQVRSQQSRFQPVKFYLNLLRWPYSSSGGGQAVLASLLLAVSQAATVAGFVWEKMADGPMLPRPMDS